MAVIVGGQGITHENIFFDEFAEKLSKEFYDDEILIISNFNAAYKPLDAVVFKKNSIAIIEFKDFGGEFSFNYNGEWKTKSGRIIKGGSGGKNPYEQACENRIALQKYLKSHLKEKYNEKARISVIIIFHQNVTININNLEHKDKKWLFLGNLSDGIDRIKNLVESEINFSGVDFKNLPKYFNLHNKAQKKFKTKVDENILLQNKLIYYQKLLNTFLDYMNNFMMSNTYSVEIRYPLIDGKDITKIDVEISAFLNELTQYSNKKLFNDFYFVLNKYNKFKKAFGLDNLKNDTVFQFNEINNPLINDFNFNRKNYSLHINERFGYIIFLNQKDNINYKNNIQEHLYSEALITLVINEFNKTEKLGNELLLHFINQNLFFKKTISEINIQITNHFKNYNIYNFYFSKIGFKKALKEHKIFQNYYKVWKDFYIKLQKIKIELENQNVLAINSSDNYKSQTQFNLKYLIFSKLNLLSSFNESNIQDLIKIDNYYRTNEAVFSYSPSNKYHYPTITLNDFEIIDYHYNRLNSYGDNFGSFPSMNQILKNIENVKKVLTVTEKDDEIKKQIKIEEGDLDDIKWSKNVLEKGFIIYCVILTLYLLLFYPYGTFTLVFLILIFILMPVPIVKLRNMENITKKSILIKKETLNNLKL